MAWWCLVLDAVLFDINVSTEVITKIMRNFSYLYNTFDKMFPLELHAATFFSVLCAMFLAQICCTGFLPSYFIYFALSNDFLLVYVQNEVNQIIL